MKEILALIQKDITLEWRQRYAINGILLHAVASTMVVFMSIKMMNAPTWNAIYWIVLLFSSVSAVAKSFVAESTGRQLYYYGIVSAQHLIVSKLIYNAVLTLVLSLLCLFTYSIFLGFPVQSFGYFVLVISLGAIGFSSTFTLLSSIASKSGNGNLLMPVLSFPVIIPLLIVAIKASKKAMDGLDPSVLTKDLLVLLAINVLIVTLAYILFPFLWKD
ncbi:MAG: heme exporter protein CcmB [Bacteroidia bacterium]|nr:heme exporter protein CcmB [Bacteroidia bacterium]MCC7532818.1 heme exporter protein CcmB [Bacteroidia bacterium]MCZ2141791.1 heme exporter protein CcmB [Bacteroidia bacterium]